MNTQTQTIAYVYADSKCTKRIGRIRRSGNRYEGIYYARLLSAAKQAKTIEEDIADQHGKPIYVVNFA